MRARCSEKPVARVPGGWVVYVTWGSDLGVSSPLTLEEERDGIAANTSTSLRVVACNEGSTEDSTYPTDDGYS